MNPVFWNKTKYTALEKNTFWLSETPNKTVNTYTDENDSPAKPSRYRICSYVVLQTAPPASGCCFSTPTWITPPSRQRDLRRRYH